LDIVLLLPETVDIPDAPVLPRRPGGVRGIFFARRHRRLAAREPLIGARERRKEPRHG